MFRGLLLSQGKSTHLLKHAIPSQQERRVLLIFGKSQPKKLFHSESPRFSSPSPAPLTSPWGPPLLVPPNIARRPPGLKQYVVVSNAGVLPPPNGIQPLLVAPTPAPVPMPVPVPVPPVSAGWALASRGPPPRLPVPGTGVFLPPSGPGHVPPPQHECNGVEKPNGHQVASPKTGSEGTGTVADCNEVAKGNKENVAQKAGSNQGAVAEAK